MNLFDLLFLVLFCAALATLLFALRCAVYRQFDRARRLLARLFIGFATYMALVILVSLLLPRRVVRLAEPQCFDDWCISVDSFQQAFKGTRVVYTLNLRLSSHAQRVSQRENNIALYLTDDRGHRYDSLPESSDVPFNILLPPQQSLLITRSFIVPADAFRVSAVITHEGGFPIAWFILGYNTWFRKPPIIPLNWHVTKSPAPFRIPSPPDRSDTVPLAPFA